MVHEYRHAVTDVKGFVPRSVPPARYAAPMAEGEADAVPRYVALAAELESSIAERQLAPHTLMPSERELAETHGVSRMTARKAVELLENEGLVYRRPPRGTFVSEARVRFKVGSFSREVRDIGRTPSARLLWAERSPARGPVRDALGLTDGDDVHVVHRLRAIDDEPIALETSYYPASLTPGLLDDVPSGSLWDLLHDRYDITVVQSTAVIEAMLIDDRGCRDLGVRLASQGLLLTRRTFDAGGRCVEYARDVYRSDRASFEVTEALQP
jgi:GntR family transcriptional regulator